MGGFIWGFTGVEGSGKSCCMTGIGLMHAAKVAAAYGYKTAEQYCAIEENKKPIMCFDGFEVHGKGALQSIKLSKTIDTAQWLGNFGADEFKNILILIDEVQNVMDSAQSGSVFARLLNHAMAQRRRAGLGLMYTLQNWEWLHKRLRWSTHLLSVCKDLSRTSWGKANGLKKGEQLYMATYDCKGFITGKEWSLLKGYRVNGPKVWPHYDSFAPASLVETQTMIQKKVQVIDWSGNGQDSMTPFEDEYMKRNDELGREAMYKANNYEDDLQDFSTTPFANESYFAKVRRLKELKGKKNG